ncbi:unnamed protein product, partial [Onchocerca flexuosa]|uniref:Protein lilliputian n=1 Tax=Onchocerca flexuosa TaxID=387005 RepID=A0A183HDP5_9BILA
MKFMDDDDYDKGNKRKCASSDDEGSKKSRSSNSSSRSPNQRRSSHERSASLGSIRSRHSEKSHRSQSRTSSYLAPAHERSSPAPPIPSPQIKRETIERGETPPLPPLPPPPNAKSDDVEPKKSSPVQSGSQSPVERKSRKSKKGKKKRRRRSPSSSSPNSVNEHTSDELSEGELRKKILKKRKEVLKDIEEGLKPAVKPTLGKWEEQEAETTLLQNTTLKFGLESTEDVPKRVLRDTGHQFQSSKNVISQTNVGKLDGIGMHATISQAAGIENSFSCKKGAKELGELSEHIDIFCAGKQLDMSKGEVPSSVALFTNDIDSFLGKREQTGPINDLKNTQVRLLFS